MNGSSIQRDRVLDPGMALAHHIGRHLAVPEHAGGRIVPEMKPQNIHEMGFSADPIKVNQ